MSELIKLKVVTPSGSRLDEEVEAVTARSELGEFCMLPGHRPILAALAAGRLVVARPGGEKVDYAVDRGFLEGGVDHANVVTERCVIAADIDAQAVAAELAEMERRLAELAEDAPERIGLERDIVWSRARLEVAGRPVE